MTAGSGATGPFSISASDSGMMRKSSRPNASILWISRAAPSGKCNSTISSMNHPRWRRRCDKPASANRKSSTAGRSGTIRCLRVDRLSHATGVRGLAKQAVVHPTRSSPIEPRSTVEKIRPARATKGFPISLGLSEAGPPRREKQRIEPQAAMAARDFDISVWSVGGLATGSPMRNPVRPRIDRGGGQGRWLAQGRHHPGVPASVRSVATNPAYASHWFPSAISPKGLPRVTTERTSRGAHFAISRGVYTAQRPADQRDPATRPSMDFTDSLLEAFGQVVSRSKIAAKAPTLDGIARPERNSRKAIVE